MESFTITGASGWQTLASLLTADATFRGYYLWTMFSIKDTHASNTIIVKSLPGTTAPSSDSGINLGPGASFTWDATSSGIIVGRDIWIKCSANSTTMDVSFINKTGV